MKKKKIIVFMPTINIGGGVSKKIFIITNYLSSKLSKITVITLSKSIKQRLDKKLGLYVQNYIL